MRGAQGAKSEWTDIEGPIPAATAQVVKKQRRKQAREAGKQARI